MKSREILEKKLVDKHENKNIYDKIALLALNSAALSEGWINEETKNSIDRQIEASTR